MGQLEKLSATHQRIEGEHVLYDYPEYVFGEDLLRNTKEVLKEQGKELAGNSYHALGEAEYSAIITKAMGAKADCVLFLNFGAIR